MLISEVVKIKRVVIFDLFFTLVSPDNVVSEFPPTYQVLGVDKSAWRQQTFDKSEERFTGPENDPYKIVGSMAHAIDPNISRSTIREATDQRIARFESILTDVPETTLSVLETLRMMGVKLALISNTDSIEMKAWLRSPLAPLLETAVFSCEIGLAKPDPRIYQHCLGLLGVRASDGIFVGDGGSMELSGAQSVGLLSVFTKGMMPALSQQKIRERELASDFVISTLEELVYNES